MINLDNVGNALCNVYAVEPIVLIGLITVAVCTNAEIRSCTFSKALLPVPVYLVIKIKFVRNNASAEANTDRPL